MPRSAGYRVSELGKGTYTLAMLGDPLNATDAAKRFYQIDLDAAATTEKVNLIGGEARLGICANLTPPRYQIPRPFSALNNEL
jgi:hypothetical protein